MSRPRRSLVVAIGFVLLIALSVGFASLASATPVPPIKQGPVASYSFDEVSGETVEDLTGDGNTATIHGAEPTAHGRYGGAMEFHGGEGEYLSVPDSPELDFTEEFTLEAWVRPSTVENFYAPVVDKLAGGGGHTSTFSYGLYAGDWEHHPFGEVENPLGSGRSVTAPEAIEARTWTHLALTFDGGRERLYENGELVDETTADPPITTEGELEIGAETEHGDHLEGRIDEVRIYERALNAGEIGLDMETPLQTPKTGPVADWSFDEGSGTTAADDTGNGHTLTLSKATWARGRYGNALKFDGKKSCASAEASPELDFTEEFTLEAWVRPIGSAAEGDPLMVQDDEAAGPSEEGYAYYFLAGENEVPKAWIREAGSGYQGIYGTEPLPRSTWSQVTLTDDGANLRLYVDGELVRTATAPPLTTGKGPLQIGCDPWGDHFNGRIDEVRAYDRVLNEAEVDADMEAPIQTPKTGPIAAYSFDEGEAGGTTVQDVTGDGHTATIHGAKWTTHGVYGGALEFDAAEEDFVSIPASTGLDGGEQLTVEAWVRPSEATEWANLVMKEREGSGPPFSWALYRYEDQALGFFDETEEGMLEGPEHSLPQDAWTHVAITDDGHASRFYVNGELVDTEPAMPIEGHGEIRLGGNALGGDFFDGRIDELRIYDRALSGGEIETDADTPLQTADTGPVAEYSFDAGEGSTLADHSGHENNGTIEAAEWTPDGRYGSALEFNGSSSCVKVPNSESLQLGEEFTLEAWVRPEGPLTEDPIFFKENDPELGFWEIPSYWMAVGFNATGKPQGYNEGAMVTGPNAIHDNTWTHLAFTYDGHALHVYVNGELEASNPVSGLAMSSKGPLYIGCAGAYEEFFQGRIDEARIYERALSWGEVKASSEIPIQTPRTGPIAAWSFDEGEGSTAEDVTGNGHEGTVEGATWAKGKYGDSLDFNGPEENCLKVPDSPSLQLREDFTIEAWVKSEGAPEYDPIIWKETGTAASYTLAVGLQGGTKAEAYIGEEEGASYERAVSPASIEPNVWTHIAATYEGRHLRLYVNGTEVASKFTTTPNMESKGPLYIGCAPDFGEWFGGRIDDVRLYERALSGSEVAASMGALPSARTAEAYGTNESETVLTARINPGGIETTYRFQYGLTENYGQTAPEAPEVNEEPVSASEPIEVEEWVGELEPETTYHYRVIATNENGTVIGQDRTVTTEAAEPEAMALFAAKTKAEKEKEEEEREKASRAAFASPVGINWNGDLSNLEAVANRVAASGAKMFRVPIGAVTGGNTELFLLLAERGITVLPNVVGIVGTSTGNKYPSLEVEPTRANWRGQLEGLLNKYGPEGELWEKHTLLAKYAPKYWEIWNEPNVGPSGANGATKITQAAWAHRYGEILEVAREAFTAADSQAKILFGGVLSVGQWDPDAKPKQEPHMTVGAFIRQVGHYGDYDALAVHPYAFTGKKAQSPTSGEVSAVAEKVMKNIRIARKAMEDVKAKWVEGIEGAGGTPPAEPRKPIWVTEFGWPVEGHLAIEDGHHRLVKESVQKELLNASFNKMKGNHGTGKHELFLENLLYYNIQDNNPSPATGLSPAEREAANRVARRWDNHCGLMENEKGVGQEEGKMREAWSAFAAQAK